MPSPDLNAIYRRIVATQGDLQRIRNDVLRRADLNLEHSLDLLLNSVNLQLQTLQRLLEEADSTRREG